MKKFRILLPLMALAVLAACDSGSPAETTAAATTAATSTVSYISSANTVPVSTADSHQTSPTETTADTTATSPADTTADVTTEATTEATTDVTAETSADPTETTSETTSETSECNEVFLYIPFNLDEPESYPLPCIGEPDASILLQGLAGLTGWNCDVNSVEILGDTARVDLAQASLPLSYDGSAETSTFFPGGYADTVFLFLDSVERTLVENLNVTGVIFTQGCGQTLTLEKLNTTLELFPKDTLYRGSLYYRTLLNDDPQIHGYPLIQLAGGMTLMYPNGYNIDLEHEDEFRVSNEQGTVICYRTYPISKGTGPEMVARQNVKNWVEGMDSVDEQFSSPDEYRVDARLGEYRFLVVGVLSSDETRWLEITFLYECDYAASTVDPMDQIISDLTEALKAYN